MGIRLSVVVPFRDVADYIGACLSSLAQQTVADMEVICVDDGSRDASAHIVRDFCRADSRFHLVTQRSLDHDPGTARNCGLSYCEGEYLAFVDADDIVPRRGYAAMMAELEKTGSSFAAGNARRFGPGAGTAVRASWLHRGAFATARSATTVHEHPALIIDRMVWNKLYRRDFWQMQGYKFPAMMLQDYPVMIQAYLDATTVDCVAEPVYYWRERDDGSSITQSRFDPVFLADRVASARLVLDIIDQRSPELGQRVRGHFAHIDVATLTQAFAVVPVTRRDEILDLTYGFVTQLTPQAFVGLPAIDQIQHAAVLARDVDLLVRLAEFRLAGGVRGGLRARRWPGRRAEYPYPGLTPRSRSVPRHLYQVSAREIALRTTVTSVAWRNPDQSEQSTRSADATGRDSELILRGAIEVRHRRDSDRHPPRLALLGPAGRTRLHVGRVETIDSHGDRAQVGFVVRMPAEVLTAACRSGGPLRIEAALRVGRDEFASTLTRLGPGSPSCPPGSWIADDLWLQPAGGPGGELLLHPISRPAVVSNGAVDGDDLVLHGVLPAGVAEPEIVAIRPGGLSSPARFRWDPTAGPGAFTARWCLADLIDEATPDDPVAHASTWGLWMVGGGGRRMVLAAGLTRPAGWLVDGRLLRLTRSPGGYVNLRDQPVAMIADSAEISLDRRWLWVGGVGPTPPITTVRWSGRWRGRPEPVEVPGDLAGHASVAGGWRVRVELDRLLRPDDAAPPTVDVLAPVATWELRHGPGVPVSADNTLASRLPIEVPVGRRMARLVPGAEGVRVEVRDWPGPSSRFTIGRALQRAT